MCVSVGEGLGMSRDLLREGGAARSCGPSEGLVKRGTGVL